VKLPRVHLPLFDIPVTVTEEQDGAAGFVYKTVLPDDESKVPDDACQENDASNGKAFPLGGSTLSDVIPSQDVVPTVTIPLIETAGVTVTVIGEALT